jgi:peptidyl-prolyl cis-trans isomerase-like 3
MSVTLHTNLGQLKLELFTEQCPKACENFLALCASHFYDGLCFERNIRGFIVQIGEREGDARSESIWGAPFKDEIVAGLRHAKRGMLAMANDQRPDTNRCAFYITYAKQEHLDGSFTVFGHVIHGLDTLEKMEKTPVDAEDRPVRDITLKKVQIHANPFAK